MRVLAHLLVRRLSTACSTTSSNPTLGNFVPSRYNPRMTATQKLFAHAVRLPSEERRFLAEIIWQTVDADLPAQWENEATLGAEIERRFEEFKAGRERGLSHDDVFSAARSLAA